MLPKTIRCHLAAGIAVISLSTQLEAQDPAASSKQVLTPWGYRDGAHFHQIPDGYDLAIMPDGHVRMENRTTGDHIDFRKSAAPTVKPLPDNGWQTAASWYNSGNTVTSFATTGEFRRRRQTMMDRRFSSLTRSNRLVTTPFFNRYYSTGEALTAAATTGRSQAGTSQEPTLSPQN